MFRIKVPSPAALAVVVTLAFAAPVQAVGWDFAGLWPDFGTGWVRAFTWLLGSDPAAKHGASTDPDGLAGSNSTAEAGAGTDPNGLAGSSSTTEAGAATDPNGLASSGSTTEHGSSTDPNGGPQ